MRSVVRLLAPLLLTAASAPPGYLASGSLDLRAVLPPAPVAGEARYEADRKVFRETRALSGDSRWRMAQNDVKLDAGSLFADFSCAAGLVLSEGALPRLTWLLARASRDTSTQTNAVKNEYKRQRPFLIDAGPICEPAGDVIGSYDYPSGHATKGWTWALVLAEAMPDHATAILARGRAFAQSRVVCGVHNDSAALAGMLSASATMDVVRTTPAYQADLALARTELTELAAAGHAPDPATCAAEQALVARRLPD